LEIVRQGGGAQYLPSRPFSSSGMSTPVAISVWKALVRTLCKRIQRAMMWTVLHAPWKRSWRGTAPSVHDEVLQHFEQTEARSKFRFLCDCPVFWSSTAHMLWHCITTSLQIIDAFEMMSALQPVRKRVRPPEKARDVEDGVKSVKPARWRKQLIRSV
jgi:hypothetical protein